LDETANEITNMSGILASSRPVDTSGKGSPVSNYTT
jgi:hypothetical protein